MQGLQILILMQTIFNNAPDSLQVVWGEETLEDLGAIREKYEKALNSEIHTFTF